MITTTTLITTALKKCTTLSHIKQIQSHLITTNLFQFHPFFGSKLIKLAPNFTNNDPFYATLIFNSITNPSIYDWNSIIWAHTQSPKPLFGFTLFVDLVRAQFRPDPVTCSLALKACARSLCRVEGWMVHCVVVKLGFSVDVRLMTSLMDWYCKNGEFGCVRKVFDEMPERDLTAWNVLICGLGQGGFANEGLEVFYRMCKKGLKGDEVSVIGALSACSQLGCLKGGEDVWCYVKAEELDLKVNVCNAVIDMYCKCGFVEKGYNVFWNMRCRKNVITWNTMIMGFAMYGNGVEVIELLKEMERDGVCPDSITYLGVLCGCNHAGLVDEGYELFRAMEGTGVVRNLKHYGTVVDLLGRAGRIDEAYGVIKSMPIEPDIVLWQTLLGACNTYGNVKLAEIASQKLVEMGSDSCGDFVLMSNVYATQKRWSDVGRVREAMNNDRNVKKVPGFSYTEVGGVMHKFINGDQSHANWREIYAKLEEIMYRIKEHGYVPEIRFVLHDIGEEDKEHALSYHSEKLAVAFGLLKTSQDTPIQVIKNLRICVDCHAVIKLVSKVYNREIVVRDRARFHRFKEGSCSCRDYW